MPGSRTATRSKRRGALQVQGSVGRLAPQNLRPPPTTVIVWCRRGCGGAGARSRCNLGRPLAVLDQPPSTLGLSPAPSCGRALSRSDVLLPNLRANAENAHLINKLGGGAMIIHSDGPGPADGRGHWHSGLLEEHHVLASL